MNDRPGIMLYFEDIRPAMRHLTDAEKGKLFAAILDFAQFGIAPDMDEESPVMQLAFDTIRPHIEKDATKYRLKCLKSAYSVWTRDHKEPIISFDEWIWQNRQKYAADIVAIPEYLQKILTREEGLPDQARCLTHYTNGTNDNERYQTITNDIQHQPQPQPNSNSTSTGTSTATSDATATSAAEITSTGESLEQARARNIAMLYNR